METGQHQWTPQPSGNLLLMAEFSLSPGGDKAAAPAAWEAPGPQPSPRSCSHSRYLSLKKVPGTSIQTGRVPHVLCWGSLLGAGREV